MTNTEKLAKLFAFLEEIEAYRRSISKLQFDMECCAPPDGMEQAGRDMAILGKQLHRLTHEQEYISLLEELHKDPTGLTEVQREGVRHLWLDVEKTKNQSPDFAYALDCAHNQAYGDWLEAKKASDFGRFRDTLARVIELERQAVLLRDRNYPSVYDACLDDYEEGGSSAQLDMFFARLRERIVPLVQRIQREGKPIREDFLHRPCAVALQEAMSRFLLQEEGLRESALVLMTTEHPFTETFGPRDVRVTTHYYEENFISNIFSTLHEGGHALFMQNEPEETVAQHAADRMSNAMHECISRFYENLIGRSESFLNRLYPKIQELCGDTFADVTPRELYEAVNVVRPSLIRIEADELTYCLHIMVRYELEKAFVNGDITVDDIPGLWNKKYREYLGVDVPNDAEGCLQDVHWTGGFGYFPSYALGNAYGAQILQVMKRDLDVDAAITNGELWRVRDWLKEHVFSIASLKTPEEWIRAITGEPLNPDYYLDYLEEKYTALYRL